MVINLILVNKISSHIVIAIFFFIFPLSHNHNNLRQRMQKSNWFNISKPKPNFQQHVQPRSLGLSSPTPKGWGYERRWERGCNMSGFGSWTSHNILFRTIAFKMAAISVKSLLPCEQGKIKEVYLLVT